MNNCMISDSAMIKENVIIGDNVIIEDNCYIDYGAIVRDNVHRVGKTCHTVSPG
mgnify:CR=1 FL=1